jgi:mono/diheme cytochrome c family protein
MKHKAKLLAAGILGTGVFLLTGQESAPSATFTQAQAEAGRASYAETCGKCHTPTLLGRKGEPGELPPISSLSTAYQEFIGKRGYVPPLAGKSFIDRWGSKTAGQLIARFQETADYFLPKDADRETTVNITAYILQENGAKAGNHPLTRTTDVVVSSITR